MSGEHKSRLLIPLPTPPNANCVSFTDHTKETMGAFAHRARHVLPGLFTSNRQIKVMGRPRAASIIVLNKHFISA